jgi:hypothetical protein
MIARRFRCPVRIRVAPSWRGFRATVKPIPSRQTLARAAAAVPLDDATRRLYNRCGDRAQVHRDEETGHGWPRGRRRFVTTRGFTGRPPPGQSLTADFGLVLDSAPPERMRAERYGGASPE